MLIVIAALVIYLIFALCPSMIKNKKYKKYEKFNGCIFSVINRLHEKYPNIISNDNSSLQIIYNILDKLHKNNIDPIDENSMIDAIDAWMKTNKITSSEELTKTLKKHV